MTNITCRMSLPVLLLSLIYVCVHTWSCPPLCYEVIGKWTGIIEEYGIYVYQKALTWGNKLSLSVPKHTLRKNNTQKTLMSVVTALLNNGALLLLLLIQMAPEFIKAALCCRSFPGQRQLFPHSWSPENNRSCMWQDEAQPLLPLIGKKRKINCLPWEPVKSLLSRFSPLSRDYPRIGIINILIIFSINQVCECQG